MTTVPPSFSDYSRYFARSQTVYLINMSAERNRDVYESLSGVVTGSTADSLELHITHGVTETIDSSSPVTYKITSEALGSGIQVLADLIGISTGNRYQMRLHGTLELFQRRSATRVDTVSNIANIKGNYTLSAFRKEWKRVLGYMKEHGVPPGLIFKEINLDLGAGGIGLMVEPEPKPTPLSMFFISVDDVLPVCALAELVWQKNEGEGVRCGHRFIQILKTDQERINRRIRDVSAQQGITTLDFKRNWVLTDKMVSDDRRD